MGLSLLNTKGKIHLRCPHFVTLQEYLGWIVFLEKAHGFVKSYYNNNIKYV